MRGAWPILAQGKDQKLNHYYDFGPKTVKATAVDLSTNPVQSLKEAIATKWSTSSRFFFADGSKSVEVAAPLTDDFRLLDGLATSTFLGSNKNGLFVLDSKLYQ